MAVKTQAPTIGTKTSPRTRRFADTAITLRYAKDDPIAVKVIEFCLSLGVFDPIKMSKSRVYREVEEGLLEIQDILDGKKQAKLARDFLNEV